MLKSARVATVADAAKASASGKLVAITGMAAPASNSTLSFKPDVGKLRRDMLVADTTSTLHVTRIELPPGPPQENEGRGRRRERNARPRPEPKLVRDQEREGSSRSAVSWGVGDSTGLALIDSASMPLPPLRSLGVARRAFGAPHPVNGAARKSNDDAADDAARDVASSFLSLPKPDDTDKRSFNGRVVTVRALLAGTVLTVVGRVWVDSTGAVRITGGAGIPAAITTSSLHTLVDDAEAWAWWLGGVSYVLLGAGILLGAAGAYALWSDEQERARGPRAPPVGSAHTSSSSVGL